MSRRSWIAVGLIGALVAFSAAQAQQQGGGRRGGRDRQGGDRQAGDRQGQAPGEGGRRMMDPGQMRERMLTELKDQMGATDTEWAALKPNIEKTIALQRDARGGLMGPGMGMGMGMGMGPRGARPAEEGEPPSKVAAAQRELRTTLDEKNAAPDQIARRVTALREARAKAREELQAVQKELKGQATPRQEAVLVLHGLLD
jgi:hypothetical protein